MPFDSQGDKWSCESCIRGHRSSKCAHYDRPMKRIPKAGRPLAKCSHLNGVDCSCREVWAIMVPLSPGSTVCRPDFENWPVQQQVDHVYTEGR